MNRISILLIMPLLLLSGCSTARIGMMPQRRTLGRDLVPETSVSEGTNRGEQESKPKPMATIALRDALAMALTHNPQLKAFSYEVRAAEARTLQAGLLPNPELEIEMEEFDRDGEGTASSEMAIGLGQLIELGGKRKWRERAAAIEGELSGWDYEEQRLRVFAETAKRFIHALAAKKELELAESSVVLAEKSLNVVAARVEAGKEPGFHTAKATTELELVKLSVLEAQRDVAVAHKKLAAMWGSNKPSFENLNGSIGGPVESLPSIEVVENRLSHNPQMARREAELELRRTVLASEKSARIPDLKLSAGFQQFEEDGTDALAFGVGLPLPLFDRNQGSVAAARYNLAKIKEEMKALETAVSTELIKTYKGLVTAHKRANILQKKVLPASEKVFSAATDGYEQGKFGYIDVLDAQRSLFKVRQEALEALVKYHELVITLEQLTGTPLSKLITETKEN